MQVHNDLAADDGGCPRRKWARLPPAAGTAESEVQITPRRKSGRLLPAAGRASGMKEERDKMAIRSRKHWKSIEQPGTRRIGDAAMGEAVGSMAVPRRSNSAGEHPPAAAALSAASVASKVRCKGCSKSASGASAALSARPSNLAL